MIIQRASTLLISILIMTYHKLETKSVEKPSKRSIIPTVVSSIRKSKSQVFNTMVRYRMPSSIDIFEWKQAQNRPAPALSEKIRAELKSAKEFLSYGEDWDGMGALPVSGEVFGAMTSMVKDYAIRLPEAGLTQLQFEINAVTDGSIDVAWYMPKARLLMNFKQTGDRISLYYYGAREGEQDAIKGQVETDHAREFLVTWMNTVLC